MVNSLYKLRIFTKNVQNLYGLHVMVYGLYKLRVYTKEVEGNFGIE